MADSALTEACRRCTETRKDGEPCRAGALWDDPLQRCVDHAGWPQSPRPPGGLYIPQGTNHRDTPCTCVAYNGPHHPCGGPCRWPEEPLYHRTTPAGQHATFRLVEWRTWYGVPPPAHAGLRDPRRRCVALVRFCQH